MPSGKYKDKATRDYMVVIRPVLSEEKKEELRELSKYSAGQHNQMQILCDMVPCSRKLAGWLKGELGI